MSRKMKLDSDGDQITIEVTDNGDVVFHNFDQEAEESAVELGFEPSPGFSLWRLINEDLLNEALIKSSKSGDRCMIKKLLFVGADIHTADDAPLWWSSRNGDIKTTKVLIESGANVNSKNGIALWWAVVENNKDLVKLLLNKGANANARNGLFLKTTADCGFWEIEYILKNWIKEHR